MDFQGGLRLKSNLTDYNQGSVAGRKTVVTSIAGLVPSPRVSPQPVRGNNSAGVGSSLAHYLSQSQR